MIARTFQSVFARLALICVLHWVLPGTVQAYSDPAAFAAPVLEAGGGGRYYTGSRAEGYGCDSCHAGRKAPDVRLDGLPSRYVPRATYELRVSWSRKNVHASAALELTDERGNGAGTLALPPAGAYIAAELCEPIDVGALAAQLYPADRDRTVAATPDCGASTLRVQWTAPSKDVGPIWLAGSVLVSNHDGTVSGDGARNFAQIMPGFGEPVPDVVTQGSCSVTSRATTKSSAIAWLWLAAILARGLTRSHAQRGLRSVRQASAKRWIS